MRNAIDNLESPFLDEAILEKWVAVNSMQVPRLADPLWVFQAHQDHIHVAR